MYVLRLDLTKSWSYNVHRSWSSVMFNTIKLTDPFIPVYISQGKRSIVLSNKSHKIAHINSRRQHIPNCNEGSPSLLRGRPFDPYSTSTFVNNFFSMPNLLYEPCQRGLVTNAVLSNLATYPKPVKKVLMNLQCAWKIGSSLAKKTRTQIQVSKRSFHFHLCATIAKYTSHFLVYKPPAHF